MHQMHQIAVSNGVYTIRYTMIRTEMHVLVDDRGVQLLNYALTTPETDIITRVTKQRLVLGDILLCYKNEPTVCAVCDWMTCYLVPVVAICGAVGQTGRDKTRVMDCHWRQPHRYA